MSTHADADQTPDDRPGYIAVVEHADGTVWVDPRLVADGVDVAALMGSARPPDAAPRPRAEPAAPEPSPPRRKRTKQTPTLFNP